MNETVASELHFIMMLETASTVLLKNLSRVLGTNGIIMLRRLYFWGLFPIVTGCLATGGHADGSGAAGDYCYGTGGLQALAI